jgi:hypothetical protein
MNEIYYWQSVFANGKIGDTISDASYPFFEGAEHMDVVQRHVDVFKHYYAPMGGKWG